MNPYRKIIAFGCAYLVLFAGISAYSGTLLHEHAGITLNAGELMFFTQASPLNVILEGKHASSGIHGCNIAVTIYGFILQGFQKSEAPHLKIIRKIFVVNPDTFTSCKSLILFPYHEFS